MDSLDALELCMLVEKEFDTHIDDDAFMKMETVGSVVDYLDSVLNPICI